MFGGGGGSSGSDEVSEKLIEMGFDHSDVVKAVKQVGPSLDDAVEYILNGPIRNWETSSSISNFSSLKRRPLSDETPPPLRESTIIDYFHKPNKRSRTITPGAKEHQEPLGGVGFSYLMTMPPEGSPVYCLDDEGSETNWELKANGLLQKHFGYPSLKPFQKEALAAWLSHQDCLVLAATGSGKSLCFQIPTLLTGKIVVVISPLISLMHDQCLKLSKHGISACFLGSGQSDSTVEQKAMKGIYDIIYVCPETILRLIKPLQKLAEGRGIALFAIDEVHCVSKWGHDFRHDYRRLSILRENFSACNLNFLKFDIPLMALTATATVRVREDVLKSLNMSKETKIVLTSFFRPNLRFLVKHSRTSASSYEKDFRQLIDKYAKKEKCDETKISKEIHYCSEISYDNSILEADNISPIDMNSIDEDCSDMDDDDKIELIRGNGLAAMKGKEMSIEYLENDVDVFQSANDCNVAFGEFYGSSPCEGQNIHGSSETGPPNKLERLNFLQRPLKEGLTIIYVPTRKETLNIAKYLCSFGVKAAAYNASLPKAHLRQVHKEFHENTLEVVVATIAFGMGIDKLNVRRIIHYGWPQSLEAYYQEAGRAGRDGKLAECILFANLSIMPSLLPSKRTEEQTNQAYKMLSDCYRYGMNTSLCRAKTLVEYFGENFNHEKCLLCDICVKGPPKMENLKEEADIFMHVIAAHLEQNSFDCCSYEDARIDDMQKPNLKTFISKIMEQSLKFSAKDRLWWRGLARIMENKGFIRECGGKMRVQIKFPEPTRRGLEFLQFEREKPFYCYPEADMLLSMDKSYSTFTYSGKGWADPEIRRERIEKRLNRNPRQRRQPRMKFLRSRVKPDVRSSRGRIAAKLQKQK